MSNINPENGLNSQHNDDAEFDPYIAELSDRCVRLNGLSFVMPGTTTLDTFPTPKPEEAELMERTFCENNGIVTFSSPEGSFATTTSKLPDGRSVTDLLSEAGYAYKNQPVPLSNGEIIVSDPEAEKAWTEILTGSLLKGAEITVIENRQSALEKYLFEVAFRGIVNANPDLADMSGTVLDEELRSLVAGGLPPPDHPDPLA